MITLEGRGLSHIYGKGSTALSALTDVNISLRSGEILMLVGPSGSGKTSLLQILGCLLKPTAGEVVVMGEQVSGLNARSLAKLRLRHFGFIFQSYNLFPTLTALENVVVAFDLHGIDRSAAHRTAHRTLSDLGLSHRLQAYPSELSGGQRQRVAIARALAGDPSVILADEPTAALDSEAGAHIAATLRKLATEQDKAILIVTHDPRISKIADRIVRIEDGRIQPSADSQRKQEI